MSTTGAASDGQAPSPGQEQADDDPKSGLGRSIPDKGDSVGASDDAGDLGARDRRRSDMDAARKLYHVTRSARHLLRAMEEFRALGIDLSPVAEAVSTSTPMGRMLLAMVAAMAALDRSLASERVKVAPALARPDGMKTNTGRPRLGFDVNGALALKEQGLTWREVAQRVGVSRSTVRRVVTPLLRNVAEGAGGQGEQDASPEPVPAGK